MKSQDLTLSTVSNILRNPFTLWLLARMGMFVVIFYRVDAGQLLEAKADVLTYYHYATWFLNQGTGDDARYAIYPAGALIFFLVPRLLSSNILTFQRILSVELLLVDLGIVCVLWRLASYVGLNGKQRGQVLVNYVLLTASIGGLLFFRYDLWPTLLSLVASLLAFQKRYRLAWVTLAVAFMAKGYPLVIAPAFVVLVLENGRRWGELLGDALAFLLTALIVALPLLFRSPSVFFDSYSFFGLRGLEIGSLYANVFMLGHLLGWPLEVEFRFLSYEVVGAGTALLTAINPFIVGLLQLALWLVLFKRKSVLNLEVDKRSFNLFVVITLSLLAFVISFKELAPQFLIWLSPFISFSAYERRSQFWWWSILLFLAAMINQSLMFFLELLVQLLPQAVLLLTTRNAVLLAYAFYLTYTILKLERPTRSTELSVVR